MSRYSIFRWLGIILACFAMPVHAQQENDAKFVELLKSVKTDHPRLLFTKEMERTLRDVIVSDPLLQRLVKQNVVNAEAMLTDKPIRYHIPDGKRLLSESRKCIDRVTALAMAFRWTGDKRFATAATQEMLIAARFKDWNPSHFLDTAEMTTALAIGYDWLYDVIGSKDRMEIREAIVRMGLKQGLRVYEERGWWTTRDNNWNQVCNGGMLMGALAIAEDEPELAAQILARALQSIPHGLRPYAPEGAYPEGPAYWQYGTTYTCLTIQALSTALGNDFGLSKAPGLDVTGNYRMHTLGPTGLYFNYADAGSNSRLSSAMWILAQTYENQTYVRWHTQRLSEEMKDPIENLKPQYFGRFFALEIAFYSKTVVDDKKMVPALDSIFRGQQDVATMRGAWNDPAATYVGFKGGDNRSNHGHMDIGSFVFDSGGVRWAVDLGSDNYNLPGYFGGKRWSYFRLNNRSHNALVIDGKLQNPKAVSRIVAFHSSENRAAAIVDMKDAYGGQVDSARRGIELVERKALHVRDELSGPFGEVRWAMVTTAEISVDGDTAVLSQDGKTLVVELRSPDDAIFKVVSTDPPTDNERSNRGTQMLTTRIAAKRGQRITIDVVMQLEGTEGVEPDSFGANLSSWPGNSTSDAE